MQLKLQRSQRVGGLTASTIFFCLDVRADYTPEERTNINRYKLGGQVIYNSRAARKHLENAGAHLEGTQDGSAGSRALALMRGATAMALAKMQLNISIASLGRGHHIECKDLEELLESEDTIREACKNVTRYLEVASTFDGSEVVIEYVNGEERVHVAPSAPPLLEFAGETVASDGPTAVPTEEFAYESDLSSTPGPVFEDAGRAVRRAWERFRALDSGKQVLAAMVAVALLIVLLRACS